MTKKVTFLHAADVHLGAPMRGFRGLTDEWAARLARAIPESFNRVIETALARRVDFVVLSGDTFDTARASYAEYLQFFEALNKLDAAGIPTYIVGGNHDPYTSWLRDIDLLPASAHLLGADGPEFATFSRESTRGERGEGEIASAVSSSDEGAPASVVATRTHESSTPLCAVGGRSYHNQTWPDDQGIADGLVRDAVDATFAIGIIHTSLVRLDEKAPVSEQKLLESGLDYWACGHTHHRLVRPSERDPRIVSPGCPQGRGIDETGDRGCYVVTLEEGSAPQLEFVPTSSVVFEQLQVDVGLCQTLGDLVHLVASTLFHANGRAHCDEMVVRVDLTGATTLHRFLTKPEVIADLRKQVNDAYPSFFCDALIDRTTMRHTDGHTQVPFVEVLHDIADEQGSRKETMINYLQSEFVKRGIAMPGSLSYRIDVMNSAAELRALDLLREEAGEDEALGDVRGERIVVRGPLDEEAITGEFAVGDVPLPRDPNNGEVHA